jgi:hypothetical protein
MFSSAAREYQHPAPSLLTHDSKPGQVILPPDTIAQICSCERLMAIKLGWRPVKINPTDHKLTFCRRGRCNLHLRLMRYRRPARRYSSQVLFSQRVGQGSLCSHSLDWVSVMSVSALWVDTKRSRMTTAYHALLLCSASTKVSILRV